MPGEERRGRLSTLVDTPPAPDGAGGDVRPAVVNPRLPPQSHGESRLRAAALAVLWPLVLYGTGCGPGDSTLPPREVVMDGRFDDWDGLLPLLEDPIDAPPGALADITRVWAAHDGAWLYLSLEVAGLVNVQAMRGTLHLVLDADGDPRTGGDAFGLPGAEWVLDLSRQDRPQPGGYGAGFALRPVGPEGIGPYTSSYDARVTGVPTHASRRFEIRLAREASTGAEGYGGLGSSVRARWVSTRGEVVLDETEVFAVELNHPPGPEPIPMNPGPLQRIPGTLRVAHWNVAEGRFRNPEGHAAVLAALRPDVVLLDEVYEEVDRAALAAFFGHPSLARLGSWSFVISRAGGRQKTVVAARDRAIRQEASMVRVDYDGGEIAGLAEAWGTAGADFLAREGEIGMSATGAWVEFDGREILLVPFDLQSAGYLDSPQDRLRVVQSETLVRHVLRALEARPPGPPPAAVVLGGDLNLVGGTTPLDRLIAGLDRAGLDLRAAELRRLGTASHTTWRDSRGGPFAPGILDMTLYSASLLKQASGFVFATEDLDDATLESLGLEREASALASDHLVLVTDLATTPSSRGPGPPR